MSIGRGGRVVARKTTHTRFQTEQAAHAPDIITIENASDGGVPESPERALMVAVLEDACLTWLGAIRSQGANSLRRRATERRWIVSNDRSWPFSFVNLCETLDIDVGKLRGRLLSLEPRDGERVPQARRHIVRSMSDRIGAPPRRTGRRPGRERQTRLAVQGFGGAGDA